MAAEGKCLQQYRSVIQRYYKQFYKINIKDKNFEDQCVMQHSNKICVVTLAPRHPILQKGKVVDVNFQVTKKLNRLNNKVVGKGKRGAQFLQSSSPLCEVTCSTGERYTLYSCVKGKLVEVNEELQRNPELLNEKPFTEGYIAVVLPKLQEGDKELEQLMTATDYNDLLDQKPSSSSDPSRIPAHPTDPICPGVQPSNPCSTKTRPSPPNSTKDDSSLDGP